MSCKFRLVPSDRIKVAFMREGLCESGKDWIRETEIAIFISPKFVKNSFIVGSNIRNP